MTDPIEKKSLVSQDEMTAALAAMRVDYDQILIKNLEETQNPMLKKRKEKQKKIASAKGAKS